MAVVVVSVLAGAVTGAAELSSTTSVPRRDVDGAPAIAAGEELWVETSSVLINAAVLVRDRLAGTALGATNGTTNATLLPDDAIMAGEGVLEVFTVAVAWMLLKTAIACDSEVIFAAPDAMVVAEPTTLEPKLFVAFLAVVVDSGGLPVLVEIRS